MNPAREMAEKIAAEPCKCVSCSSCGGTGSVWFTFDGKYLGNHRSDDLDELERCEECHAGIVELCARCETLAELEQETNDE